MQFKFGVKVRVGVIVKVIVRIRVVSMGIV